MLINGSALANCPILSLHIGGEIARVVEPIIDPNTLKVIGFKVEGKMIRDEVGNILPIDSVREFSRLGIIIDSIDEFVHDDEILRIADILKLNFALPELKVVTKDNTKLGKVADYIVEATTWNIHQLIVQRPLLKSFLDPQLIIPRKQIIEVDDYQIVVKSEHDRAKTKLEQPAANTFVPNFVNPFREPDFANEKQTKK